MKKNPTFEEAVFGVGKACTAEEVAGAYSGLAALPDEQVRIVTLRFGLFGEVPHTLYDIGTMVRSLSRERVRQIEAKALRAIRRSIKGKGTPDVRSVSGAASELLAEGRALSAAASPGPRLGQPDEIEGCE